MAQAMFSPNRSPLLELVPVLVAALFATNCGARTGLLGLSSDAPDGDAGTDGSAGAGANGDGSAGHGANGDGLAGHGANGDGSAGYAANGDGSAGYAASGDGSAGHGANDDGSAGDPDATVVPACTVAWSACQQKAPRTLVSGNENGQTPDVAWTGQQFLVVYSGITSAYMPFVDIVAVDPDGQLLWREEVGGLQSPRVAYHRGLGTGLVVVDSGLRWLDGSGKPTGTYSSFPPLGWQFAGDVSPVEDGFLVVAGSLASMSAPSLVVAEVGPTPSEPDFVEIDSEVPRGRPEHALGPDGLVTWLASKLLNKTAGELYAVSSSGELTKSVEFDALIPDDGKGELRGLAEYQNETYALYGGAPSSTNPDWSLWMFRLQSGVAQRIDESAYGNTGHLIALDDALIVSANALHAWGHVSVGRYDPATGAVDVAFVLGDSAHQGHSSRMTRWARGFAVVYSEVQDDIALSSYLEVYDCCVDE